jgi:hypothetical protein
MRTTFWTRNGSEYVVDHNAHTWRRLPNPASPLVRTDNGTFVAISRIVIGASVVLICPPLIEGTHLRIVRTSCVIQINRRFTEVDGESTHASEAWAAGC